MSKPTIDEMLEWLNQYDDEYDDDIRANAIRAILEQHRDLRPVPIGALLALRENHKLQAIRAFVDRVEKRVNDGEEFYQNAVVDELISMEKDNE